MFNKKTVVDAKQKTLSSFLTAKSSKPNQSSQDNTIRRLRRNVPVYLESSSDEEENLAKNSQSKQIEIKKEQKCDEIKCVQNSQDVFAKRKLPNPTIVYLESSSDEEKKPASIKPAAFVPSPRKYDFSSIEGILSEDKNCRDAMERIKRNLEKKLETSSFLNDSISPIKSQQAESTLMEKYMGKSVKTDNKTDESISSKLCSTFKKPPDQKINMIDENNSVLNDSQETICSEVEPEDIPDPLPIGKSTPMKSLPIKNSEQYYQKISSIKEDNKKHDSSTSNKMDGVKNLEPCTSKLCSPNKDIKVVFEPNLEKYMCDLVMRPEFKTSKNENNINVIKNSLRFFDNTYLELSEKICDIIDQVPYQLFKEIPGFQSAAFLKLKTVRQQFKAKRKILSKTLKVAEEKLQEECFDDYDAMEQIEREQQEMLEDYESQMVDEMESAHIKEPPRNQQETVKRSESVNNFKSIEKNELKNKNMTSKQQISDENKRKESDEEDELDALLAEVKKQEDIDQGHSGYDSMIYKDFVDSSKNIRAEDVPKARIAEIAPQKSDPIDIDDDGWQVYDPSQFEETKSVPLTRVKSVDSCTSSKSSGSQKVTGRFHANVQNDGVTGEFDGNNYPFSKELFQVLKSSFGLSTFRPNQNQIVNAALLGKDTFVLMPTGGGKSLCYQLPAVLSITRGVTIVVSPLRSLIFDQVSKLESLGVIAKHLSGDISPVEQNCVYTDLSTDNPLIRILYVTPEKISNSPRFQDILDFLFNKNLIARFVIDEAHCVSQWGHDFRPDYKKLSVLRKRYKNVPMMALTASATPRVRVDILQQLGITNCKWFLSSFNRDNLKYVVVPKTTATNEDMATFIKSRYNNASGIIYCLSRKECEEIAQKMSQKGIKSAPYHAGLTDKVRESIQKDWITNKFKVICATIAFGMGIDKPDVRYVLHFSLPKSIEGYYQESGRAGRDGEISHCILYYSYRDMIRMRKIIDLEKSQDYNSKQVHITNLNRIVGYCENITECRRALQLEYFGEHFTSEECLQNRETACDNCLRKKEIKTIDVTKECKQIMGCVRELCGDRNRFTLLHITDVLKGSSIKKIMDNHHNKSKFWGCLKTWEKSEIERILRKMVIEEYLREDLIFSKDIPQAYLYLGPNVNKLMSPNSTLKIEFGIKTNSKSIKTLSATTTTPFTATSSKAGANKELTELQNTCYHELLDLCRKLSFEKGINLASIMNIQALKAMSELMPESEEDFKKIPHVTNTNYQKYGEQLLAITKTYAAQKKFMIDDESMDESDEDLMGLDLSGADFNDGVDWDREAFSARNSATTSSGSRGRGGRGFKRKRTYKNSSYKKAKSSPGNSSWTSTNAKRGGRGRGRAAAASSSSSRGRGASSSISKFNLLPVPGSR